MEQLCWLYCLQWSCLCTGNCVSCCPRARCVYSRIKAPACCTDTHVSELVPGPSADPGMHAWLLIARVYNYRPRSGQWFDFRGSSNEWPPVFAHDMRCRLPARFPDDLNEMRSLISRTPQTQRFDWPVCLAFWRENIQSTLGTPCTRYTMYAEWTGEVVPIWRRYWLIPLEGICVVRVFVSIELRHLCCLHVPYLYE